MELLSMHVLVLIFFRGRPNSLVPNGGLVSVEKPPTIESYPLLRIVTCYAFITSN